MRPLVSVFFATGLVVGCSLSSVGWMDPDASGGKGGRPAGDGGTRASGGSAASEGGGAGQSEGGEGSGAGSGGSDGGLGGSAARGGTAGDSSVGGSAAGDAGAAGSGPDCIELGNCENPPMNPLVASYHTSCFLTSDSTVRCWGSDGAGTFIVAPSGTFSQLSGGNGGYGALGTSNTITIWNGAWTGMEQPGDGFVQVAAYGDITLGLRPDGTVQGWGDGNSPGGPWWTGPLDETARFKRVIAGTYTACGLHANGAATCWRYPHVSLGVGGRHSCLANVDGTLQCWGDDALGQASPPASDNFVKVSAGAEHSCAIKATGDIWCWGANTHGESTPIPGTYNQITSGKGYSCGRDVPNDRINCWGALPFPESAITHEYQSFSKLAAGDAHVCQATRPVICFGDDSEGQSSPPPDTYVMAIASGSAHTCGVLDGGGRTTPGSIRCWGDNSDLQSTPPDGTFFDIAAGERHTCALSATGRIVCWGNNDHGQTNAPSGQFVAVGAGGSHSCGRSVTGNTVCWGDSSFDQLDAPPPPTFKELALGGVSRSQDSIVCGIRSDDTRFCSNALRPLATLPEPNLSRFSISDTNLDAIICALRPNKTAVCWGEGNAGLFGNTNAILNTPPDELDFVSVGSFHACGVRPNRTVVCWGLNPYGELNVPADLAGP